MGGAVITLYDLLRLRRTVDGISQFVSVNSFMYAKSAKGISGEAIDDSMNDLLDVMEEME